MIKVWLLVFVLSTGSNGQTAITVDGISTLEECRRVAEEIPHSKSQGGITHRCIEYWKVK